MGGLRCAKFDDFGGVFPAGCQPIVDLPEVTMKILSHIYSGKDIASLLCTCHAFGASLRVFAHSHLKVQNRLLQHWKRRSIVGLPEPLDVWARSPESLREVGGPCMIGKMRIRLAD